MCSAQLSMNLITSFLCLHSNDDLPVISPLSDSVVSSPSANDISAPLFEDEIRQAISELRSGRAPSSDGISLEMLNLGGEESIRWLKSIFDSIWETKLVPEDWQSQLLVPYI